MSRLKPLRPGDAELFERQGGHYYLPVWAVEGENGSPAEVIPLTEVSEVDSGSKIKICNECGMEDLVRYKFCMGCAAKFEEENGTAFEDDNLRADTVPTAAASSLLLL